MSGSSGMSSLPRRSELTNSNSESVRDMMYDDKGDLWLRSRTSVSGIEGCLLRGETKHGLADDA